MMPLRTMDPRGGGGPGIEWAAVQLVPAVAGALRSGVPRRHRTKITAYKEIGPEIAHPLSVSLILRY
jgi:hypothetical protein